MTGNDDAWLDEEGNWHVDIESSVLQQHMKYWHRQAQHLKTRDQKEMDRVEAIVGVAALAMGILLIIIAFCF